MKPNERTLNILSELVKNSLEADSSDVNVKIKKRPEYIEITVQDNGKGMDVETMKKVETTLNQSHKRVYDDYYGGLAGINQSASGLNIVGFQVDDVEIESNTEGTTIRVRRERKKNN